MMVFFSTKALMINNTVSKNSGTVIHSIFCDLSQHSEDCFLQVLQNYSGIYLVFVNNSAFVGSDIYGGMLDW